MHFVWLRIVDVRCVCALCIVVFMANSAHAIDVTTVRVGNAGNRRDPTFLRLGGGAFGAVDYPFRIGKFEVTNAEYAEFLNAVGKTDSYALYNPEMGNNPRGGILRTGIDGSFSYDVKPNMGNKPVNFVSYWDATRFANWLHNGQPNGDQGNASTEQGAYSLNGIEGSTGEDIIRNETARWFVPSEDEWYKAAFHHPRREGGDSDNYWYYAMATPLDPVAATADEIGDVVVTDPQMANYLSTADWNGQDGNVTSVGSAGGSSESFYGTADQSGNVSEWTEGLFGEGFPNRMVRGGSWESRFPTAVSSAASQATQPQIEVGFLGFRVATIVRDGDYNADGLIDIHDVEILRDAVEHGDNSFDLTGDGIVDSTDIRIFTEDPSLLNSWIGDVNGDGEFGTSDLTAVFQAGQFEDNDGSEETTMNSVWATGDWNGDGEFDTADFVFAFQGGGFEEGPRVTVVSVPEPDSMIIVLGGCVGSILWRRSLSIS